VLSSLPHNQAVDAVTLEPRGDGTLPYTLSVLAVAAGSGCAVRKFGPRSLAINNVLGYRKLRLRTPARRSRLTRRSGSREGIWPARRREIARP